MDAGALHSPLITSENGQLKRNTVRQFNPPPPPHTHTLTFWIQIWVAEIR